MTSLSPDNHGIPFINKNCQRNSKSSIREFIFYIKFHFPLYLDLLIDNVTDITIATELMSSDTLDQSSGPPRN